jgi:DNA polymerase-3 subunit alpha
MPTKKSSKSSNIEPWPQTETLGYEKELLGYFVSGHPLDACAGHFDSGKYNTIAQAKEAAENGTFKLAGLVSTVEKRF